MRYLLTSLLCVFTLSLTAQDDCLGPDFNSDGVIGAADLIVFLTYYGYEWPLVTEFVCGETIAHHDYDYSTVLIGEQCWFSENCRYLPVVSPSSEGSETDPYYYVYDYEGTDVAAAQATGNYETYGVLYNWPAVMFTSGWNPANICPSGWHIPSDEEFTELTDFLGGESVAGVKMKDAVQWNGSNSSGFSGLPGSYRNSGGFGDSGTFGFPSGIWWSASEWTSNYSWVRELNYAYDNVYHFNYNRLYGFSARCVRD
jgi:uncharacterized protein (TIGR02145 family)